MKYPFYVFALIIVAIGINACSDNKNSLDTNQCPQDAVCIYKDISISQNVMPNAYKANIRITESDTLRKGGEIESSVKKDIANTLNEITKLSKERGFCEGGNHDLRPNIQYKDGAARDTVGYTLSFSLECDVPSKKKAEYDTLIADIDKKINKNKYLSFLAPNVNIIITPEMWQKAQDDAFGTALEAAKNKEKHYSKILSKKCTIAQANETNTVSSQPDFARTTKVSNVSAYADVSWELPIPKGQDIVSKIQAKYVCF